MSSSWNWFKEQMSKTPAPVGPVSLSAFKRRSEPPKVKKFANIWRKKTAASKAHAAKGKQKVTTPPTSKWERGESSSTRKGKQKVTTVYWSPSKWEKGESSVAAAARASLPVVSKSQAKERLKRLFASGKLTRIPQNKLNEYKKKFELRKKQQREYLAALKILNNIGTKYAKYLKNSFKRIDNNRARQIKQNATKHYTPVHLHTPQTQPMAYIPLDPIIRTSGKKELRHLINEGQFKNVNAMKLKRMLTMIGGENLENAYRQSVQHFGSNMQLSNNPKNTNKRNVIYSAIMLAKRAYEKSKINANKRFRSAKAFAIRGGLQAPNNNASNHIKNQFVQRMEAILANARARVKK